MSRFRFRVWDAKDKENWVKCTKNHNDLKLATAPQCETPYITNGDRIRSMSDEELAKLFVYFKRRTTDEDVYGSILFKQIPFEGKQRAIEETLEELKKEVKDK